MYGADSKRILTRHRLLQRQGYSSPRPVTATKYERKAKYNCPPWGRWQLGQLYFPARYCLRQIPRFPPARCGGRVKGSQRKGREQKAIKAQRINPLRRRNSISQKQTALSRALQVARFCEGSALRRSASAVAVSASLFAALSNANAYAASARFRLFL